MQTSVPGEAHGRTEAASCRCVVKYPWDGWTGDPDLWSSPSLGSYAVQVYFMKCSSLVDTINGSSVAVSLLSPGENVVVAVAIAVPVPLTFGKVVQEAVVVRSPSFPARLNGSRSAVGKCFWKQREGSWRW